MSQDAKDKEKYKKGKKIIYTTDAKPIYCQQTNDFIHHSYNLYKYKQVL